MDRQAFSKALKALAHDRRGIAAMAVVAVMGFMVAAAGFALDVGLLVNARAALQSNTNAAVLNAAYQWSQVGGTNPPSSVLTAAQGWSTSHPVPFFSSVTTSASAVCVSKTSGLPACTSGTSTNAVQLTQTGTVNTAFIRVLGFNSWSVSSTSTAAYNGGPTQPMNVMFVLDSTASMASQTDDTGCTVPGISSPTKLNCAMYGVQLILKELNPTRDNVGLMMFPGMSATWTPGSGSPSIEPYGTSGIVYQIIHNQLDNNYATTIGALNDTSLLVKAVGDYSNGKSAAITDPGGEGTFYAQAISAATAAIQSEDTSGGKATNIIIFMSDGEANQTPGDGKMDVTYAVNSACSPGTVCSPGHQVQQCNQAVANGATATADGIKVYVVAYDAGGSGTGCSAINPGDNVTAKGTISTGSTTITTASSITALAWPTNLGSSNCSGCTVIDSSVSGSPQIGTISSWTGTTITLKAKPTHAGSGSSDTLLIQSPNTVYDSPTGTSAAQWTPCSALQSAASSSSTFYSTNSSCSSSNAYGSLPSQFQQIVSSLSEPRLVTNLTANSY